MPGARRRSERKGGRIRGNRGRNPCEAATTGMRRSEDKGMERVREAKAGELYSGASY